MWCLTSAACDKPFRLYNICPPLILDSGKRVPLGINQSKNNHTRLPVILASAGEATLYYINISEVSFILISSISRSQIGGPAIESLPKFSELHGGCQSSLPEAKFPDQSFWSPARADRRWGFTLNRNVFGNFAVRVPCVTD